MAGGDLNVKVGPGLLMGSAGMNSRIDANSTASGNMTEAVKVGKQTVYMTKEGKELFEAKAKEANEMGFREPSVETDPGFIARIFGMGVTGEQAVGKP